MIEVLPYVAVGLFTVTTILLLIGREWRLLLGALAIQYVGVFFMVAAYWPISMAVIKVVVGWMTAVALGISQAGSTSSLEQETSLPTGRIFRLLAASLIFLVVFSLSSPVLSWFPGIQSPEVVGSLMLVGMGLLQLGMTVKPYRVILGLLTVLAGFEILYAAVEASVLVAGLLAVINLGLALMGAYLISVEQREDQDIL